MIVHESKLYVDCFGPDELLDRGRTLIVHYVQCLMVAARFQYGDDFDECLYHVSIGARQHCPDDDCIMVKDEGTNRYCILLKERTGKAPVMLVYIVPVMALASAAKQNMSCIALIS